MVTPIALSDAMMRYFRDRVIKENDGLIRPITKEEYDDGEPCSHIGCLNHVTHPCENCGRIKEMK